MSEQESEGGVTILEMGREVAPLTLPKMPLRTFELLTRYGWHAKAGYSRFQKDVKVYASGQKAGEQYGGEVIDNHWIQAIHIERKKKVTAVWHDGGYEHALWGWMPELVGSLQLAALIRGDIEEPDQYPVWYAAQKVEKERLAAEKAARKVEKENK